MNNNSITFEGKSKYNKNLRLAFLINNPKNRPNFQRESLICLIFTVKLACKLVFRPFTLKLRQFAQKIRHFTVTIIRLFTVKIRPFTLKIMSFTLKNQD